MKNTICVAQLKAGIKYISTYSNLHIRELLVGEKKNGYSLYNKMFRYVKIPKPSYSKETYD